MKPRVLSVKLGYNPNSSGVGIVVKVFLWGTLAVSLFFGLVSSIISLKKKPGEEKNTKEQGNE